MCRPSAPCGSWGALASCGPRGGRVRRVWSWAVRAPGVGAWAVRAPGVGRGEVWGLWIIPGPIALVGLISLGLNQIPNTIEAKVKNSEGRTKVGYGAIG